MARIEAGKIQIADDVTVIKDSKEIVWNAYKAYKDFLDQNTFSPRRSKSGKVMLGRACKALTEAFDRDVEIVPEETFWEEPKPELAAVEQELHYENEALDENLMVEYETVARECIDLQNQLTALQERNANISYSFSEVQMADEGNVDQKMLFLQQRNEQYAKAQEEIARLEEEKASITSSGFEFSQTFAESVFFDCLDKMKS